MNLQERILELIQNDKYKDSMLATVTHDLRTPINLIKHLVSQCQHEQSPEKQRELLDFALTNSDLLLSLVNDILDFSQLKEYNFQHFDFKQLLGELQALMNFQTKQKAIEFQVINRLNSTVDSIYNDKIRLKQVLINLLTNAVKFTREKGRIALKVKQSKTQGCEQKQTLQISVTDNGVGIKQENIPKLQQMYNTINQGNMNNNGIGLGLFLSKNIIQNIGKNNEFRIKSEVNKMTKFSFNIFYKKVSRDSEMKELNSSDNL